MAKYVGVVVLALFLQCILVWRLDFRDREIPMSRFYGSENAAAVFFRNELESCDVALTLNP